MVLALVCTPCYVKICQSEVTVMARAVGTFIPTVNENIFSKCTE